VGKRYEGHCGVGVESSVAFIARSPDGRNIGGVPQACVSIEG